MTKEDIFAEADQLLAAKREVQQKIDPLQDLKAEIAAIRAELRELRNLALSQPQTINTPTGNPFAQITEFTQAMTGLSQYNQSVIDGYKQQAEGILADMPKDSSPAEETPENYFMKVITDKLLQQKQSGQPAGGLIPPLPPAVDPKPANNIVPNSGGSTMDINKVAAQMPPQIKEAIKRGSLSLENCKQMIAGSQYKDLVAPKDVEAVYNQIRGDNPVTGKEQPNEKRLYDAVKSNEKKTDK
tara:strand:+ start:3675 stop:4400 length:726 start_codon:yes stop_codon:yes gene_type:complete